MEQVRCTNCGSSAIIPDGSGEYCTCEACGSVFYVPKAAAFSKVTLDHTQDVRAWREYLAKQVKLQSESSKARDYGGVKLFAQKILSVLPDDFCAQYYVALAERYDDDNDTAFTHFLAFADLVGVTEAERKEVVDSLVSTVEPKYLDDVKAFIKRAYPDNHMVYDAPLERSIRLYIQKLKYARASERDVFICHRTAAPDQDIADAICSRLEERGLRCWIAPRNILAGSQNYERDIMKGVESCRLFLLVSSFKSIYSEDCEMELKAAVLDDKTLYSYRIDDTPYDGAFEKALAKVQWLDASDDPYAHLEQLVVDIKGMLVEDVREKAEIDQMRFAARERERLEAAAARSAEQERLDRLEKLVSNGVAPSRSSSASRLKRAEIEIQSGNFSRAETVIDETLDLDPENPLAWWLMLLCTYRASSDRKLLESGKDYTVSHYYKNAVRFADTAMRRRRDAADAQYANDTIKRVDRKLAEAEKLFETESFDALADTLAACAGAFVDEDSLVFERFPDVASRFFWLKLWAKYGQTPLVCVEDITREKEYALAVKYASPTQAKQYESARETVSKNAQLFLRERSKNRCNDGKLVDYLVDNKNILPPEAYAHYSSLLYFRKMLDQLGMTEEQLRASDADISTNEYFMLAQSIATDEQRAEYDGLCAALDRNRAEKQRRELEAKRVEEEKERKKARHARSLSIARKVFVFGFAPLSYVMLALALCVGPYTASAFLLFSTLLRFVADIACAYSSGERSSRVIARIDLAASIIAQVLFAEIGSYALGFGFFMPVNIGAIALEIATSFKLIGKGRRGGKK